MSDAKRDAAPRGWFRRMLARIECVLDFLFAVLFFYLGGAGLVILVMEILRFGLKYTAIDLLVYAIELAIPCLFLLLGLWCLKEFRRDRQALRAMR